MTKPIEKIKMSLLLLIYKRPYSDKDARELFEVFNDIHGDAMQIRIVESRMAH